MELALVRALPGDLSILTPSPAMTPTRWPSPRRPRRSGTSRPSVISPPTRRRSSSGRRRSPESHRRAAGLKAKYGLDIKPDNFIAISDGGGPATVRALVGRNGHGGRHLQHLNGDPAENGSSSWKTRRTTSGRQRRPLVSSQKKSDELKKVLDAGVGQTQHAGTDRTEHRRIGQLGCRPG